MKALHGPLEPAAFLHERLPLGVELEPAQRSEAESALAAWRGRALADDELFDLRLRSARLSREEFVRILAGAAEPSPAGRRSLDATAAALRRIFSRAGRRAELPDLGRLLVGGDGGLPFPGLLRPFVAEGLRQLRARAAGLTGAESAREPAAETELLRQLGRRLLVAALPTLVLELNVARLRGELTGASSQARYHHFGTVLLARPARRRQLLAEYPVLARLLVQTTESWLEASLEMLVRLQADRPLLAATFGRNGLGPLTVLEGGLSDGHRGGRGVWRLGFADGTTVMYKPRGLAVERVFQELLGWLNRAGLRYPQRTLRVVEREGYGWVEHVAAAGCASSQGVERFYWRQGSFLALLYLLQASDFHYENLIAAGEHPVLVDLEGLFHPRVETRDSGRARSRAQRRLTRSVFGVGLLPLLIFGRGRRVADFSGIGAGSGQVFPRPMPVLREVDTDEMRIDHGDVVLRGGRNRPRLGDREVDPGRYAESLAAGFAETHALLRARRHEMAERLAAFSQVEVRFIARPTLRYSALLQDGWHPDVLRDARERERLLDRLWLEARPHDVLRALVPSEQDDLRVGDVPLFTCRPGSRDVWDSRGRRLADFLPEPPLEAAQRRLADFDEHDAARQLEWIAQAVVPSGGPSAVSQPDTGRASLPGPAPRREEALAAALAIGEHLASQAVLGDEDVAWIGPTLRPGEHWRWEVAPLGTSLYEGLGGVALFLAHLGRAAGRPDLTDLARRAAVTVAAAAAQPGSSGDVGAFSGLGGLVYVLWHLAQLWSDTRLLDAAFAALPALERHVPADEGLDVLLGSAGCAQVMLGLHRATGEVAPLAVARACGERLLAASQPLERGRGWVGAAARLPLAGFAHGVAGIAWSLLELAEATGDARLHAAALEGLAYERSLFVPESRTWRDRREFEGAPEGFVTVAWCHGAAGLALGRALALSRLDDAAVREEIDVGVEETLRSGFGGNQSLCHGDLGAAEIVLHVGRRLGRSDWCEAALAQAGRVVREAAAGEWRCGLPRHTRSPGLMTGLAGLGFGLLRLAQPESVPGVLWLEAPR